MIIYHSYCLHERVADNRSHKSEPVILQIFTHSVGLNGLGRYLFDGSVFVLNWFPFRELPNVAVEGSEFTTNI